MGDVGAFAALIANIFQIFIFVKDVGDVGNFVSLYKYIPQLWGIEFWDVAT